ncbi:MAG TPA: hypothetical protein VMV57_10435 [Terracidiphilus sp.]|nr:hypothetical protein [Terracidiphilus sp.]
MRGLHPDEDFLFEVSAEVIYADSMSIETILAQLDAEIERLKQAHALLANSREVTSKMIINRKATKAVSKVRKQRVLSPEARKRIADAQRRRWAAHKKAKAKVKVKVKAKKQG